MSTAYYPPRQVTPTDADNDPLEIELVLNVRPCGTCSFFWPTDPAQQPYGPYSTFDFTSDAPATPTPPPGALSFPWITGVTRSPGFPDPEVMDGCRKAPIMTIGINPNLTAFAPGQMGAAWCYPSFSSDSGEDSWAKYAFYYRYRSIFQERFALEFAKQFLTPAGRIVAARSGSVTSTTRISNSPAYSIQVLYDGDTSPTTINLPGTLGAPPYVVLFDPAPPNNRFTAGDVIAGQITVPPGQTVQVYEQQVGYYERIVPMLAAFTSFLKAKGHAGASLRVGEDVCQLDMVACASPHWGQPWLGGSDHSVQTIISNCVAKNGWAIKQLVQTRPVLLLLVGEASFQMFRDAFGHYIRSSMTLSPTPADGAYTLLRATTDPANPVTFEFSTTVEGTPYSLLTRLIVTPHFSFPENFLPQYRLNPAEWASFQSQFPDCARFLRADGRIHRSLQSAPYIAFEVTSDLQGVQRQIAQSWPSASTALAPLFYDPNAMIEAVFEQLYAEGALVYVDGAGNTPGQLKRGDGACSFCVNAHWSFPAGCPYDKLPKPNDAPLPDRFLQQVAAQLLAEGASHARFMSARMLDDSYEARRDPLPLG
jgi:hypothetical protein